MKGKANEEFDRWLKIEKKKSISHTKMGLMSKREKKSSSSLSTSPCAHLRVAYQNCFNSWYSDKFVKGQWDKEGCVSEWQKYRACLSEHLDDKHLSRFLEAEGLVDSCIQADLRNPVDGVSQ